MNFILLLCTFLSVFGSSVCSTVGYCEFTEWSSTSYDCEFSSDLFKHEADITQINGIHSEGFNDSNVSGLQASFGSIIPVPPTIICDKYENLRHLLLMNVRLHSLTDNSFSQCYNLQTLYLSFNRIRVIHADAFRNNVELTFLSIRDNEIVHIEDNSFRNLVHLEILELTRNRITHISDATFRGLINVVDLSLQGNQLVELSSNMFSNLTRIEWLHFFSNRITRIHPEFLETLPNSIFRLNLSNNECIDSDFMFSAEFIDEVQPYFRECFENYESI